MSFLARQAPYIIALLFGTACEKKVPIFSKTANVVAAAPAAAKHDEDGTSMKPGQDAADEPNEKTYAHGPAPKALLSPAKIARQAPKAFNATFVTSKGSFVVSVNRTWGPHGADRFYSLVKAGYFDGTRFFNMRKGRTVEFGIHGHPAVSKAWLHAWVLDDFPKLANGRGAVSFHSRGSMTRTVEVVINLTDDKAPSEKPVVPFGVVTSGLDVVESLYADYGPVTLDGDGPGLAQTLINGNAYLEREFPKMDYVKSARITP